MQIILDIIVVLNPDLYVIKIQLVILNVSEMGVMVWMLFVMVIVV